VNKRAGDPRYRDGDYHTRHPQVRIRHGKVTARVDERLAPLIAELWKAGWETIRSCQRHTTGRVWIEFAQAPHVEKFLNVVAPYDPGPGSLWRRAKAWGFGQFGPASEPFQGQPNEQEEKGAWSYHVRMTDGSYCNATGERFADGPQFCLSINVLFPRRDLAKVLAHLRHHNGSRALRRGHRETEAALPPDL
jgi:hypothetical protein